MTPLGRRGNDLLVRQIDVLRDIVRTVRRRHPFRIHAWMVLPDHLHCIIELPPGDVDDALRWRLIKSGFSKALPVTENPSSVRRKRGERGIWQRRYREHRIRDERDVRPHADDVHGNPLKHGLARRAADWPCSTFHGAVDAGLYPPDRAGENTHDALGYDD